MNEFEKFDKIFGICSAKKQASHSSRKRSKAQKSENRSNKKRKTDEQKSEFNLFSNESNESVLSESPSKTSTSKEFFKRSRLSFSPDAQISLESESPNKEEILHYISCANIDEFKEEPKKSCSHASFSSNFEDEEDNMK
jgi:hypothetical protein